MIAFDELELRRAIRARNRTVALYIDLARVSLIDIGLRIVERADNQITAEPRVRVHVRDKPRGAAFEALVADRREQYIDKQRIGYPVDIIEADYRLDWYWWNRYRQPPPRARVFDPLQGGISISNAWGFGYGTLGGLVRDRHSGKVKILSNWHVLAGAAHVPVGIQIYQPGYGDGGRARDTVARLDRHAMHAGLDAAVAELTGARSWTNDQLEIGPVSGAAAATLDMRVIKSGRTSQITEGVVTGIGGVRRIQYGRFGRIVRHIVHIAQTPVRGEVSAPGDSGSWWLAKSSQRAVGLHFAGNNLPEYGLAVSMPEVLEALNVEIATRPARRRMAYGLEPEREVARLGV